MCRWAAYFGKPIYLEEIVSAPNQSLLDQSRHALESKTETNGDGFGVAWYGARQEPGIYRDVLPAWADPNLCTLAHQITSGCFMAHVRASTGTATSRTNCHPFNVGQWSFMHNGQVGGFEKIRRQADMMIDEAHYPHRLGTTDSEAMFLIALGLGLTDDPKTALQQATARLEQLSKASGRTPHMRMTVALSDGNRLFAARYASDDHAPSLYVGQRTDGAGYTIVSEPLGGESSGWHEVEPGQFLTVTADGMTTEPFVPTP